MDHHGFIHEKLDIKLLILFILSRLPAPVDRGTLDELCQQCDDGVGYFDYSDCLGELIATGHVVGEDEEYAATEKGKRDGREVESSLPYSVRARALKLIAPVEERMMAVEKAIGMPERLRAFAVFPFGYPAEEKKQQDRFDPGRIHWMD